MEKRDFPEWMRNLGRVCRTQGRSMFTEVPLRGLMKAMSRIRERGIPALNGISGHDNGKEIEMLYHFIHQGIVLTVRTRVRKELSALPTVTGVFPSARLFEQENHEMLGVVFTGNTGLRPLLLGKTSPATPLRKEEGHEG